MNINQTLAPLQAIKNFWGTLNPTQRFISVAFISLSVVLLIVTAMLATKPRMVPLFSGLQAEDAGTIVSKLQEEKVPYEVEGSTIKVPEKSVHELRMKLASQGLPQSGTVGFEIFDKTNLGMTEFAQRLNYQRALQGELCRTIDQLDSVEQSRVHLVIPEQSVFVDRDRMASASVVLKLHPGRTLGSDEVAGIVHLVSSAVEGLKANNVTVVDTNGRMLSEAGDDSSGIDPRLSSSQMQVKQAQEREIERNIQSMLEAVVGAGKSIVRVNASMNFDRRETDSEIYQPQVANTGVLSSEDRQTEAYNGTSGPGGKGVGGAGARGNPAGANSAGSGYQRIQTSSKYEVSKTEEHVIKSGVQLEKLSVAVMVDDKVDALKIPAIKRAVVSAAGIDLKRGDQVTVDTVSFDFSEIDKEKKEMDSLATKSTVMDVAKILGGLLAVVGFLFFLRYLLTQVRIAVPNTVTVEEITPIQAKIVQDIEHASGHNGNARPNVQLADDSNPEEIAKVLRKWMSDN